MNRPLTVEQIAELRLRALLGATRSSSPQALTDSGGEDSSGGSRKRKREEVEGPPSGSDVPPQQQTEQPPQADEDSEEESLVDNRKSRKRKSPDDTSPDLPTGENLLQLVLGGDGSDVQDPKRRRVMVRSALSQSESKEVALCTTIDSRPRLLRYTILLWNVETYGESKAEANPYANVLIRHVLEDLDVDLVLFLETQRFPSQVIAAIEHRKDEELATVKERSKGPGLDIHDRRRFKRTETEEFAAEAELRQDHARLKKLVEELADWGDARYFAFSSGITGKARALPPKIGTYCPPAERPEADDCERFKKYYSYVGSRLEPSWTEYLPDLVRIYDVRLRKADSDPESTDPADFSAPLSDAEVKVLIDAVRALTFSEPDVDRLLERRRSMVIMNVDEWNRQLDERIEQLLKIVGDDDETVRYFRKMKSDGPAVWGQGQIERLEEAARAMKRTLADTRQERRELLLELERAILLTLRDPETCRCARNRGQAPSALDQPEPSLPQLASH